MYGSGCPGGEPVIKGTKCPFENLGRSTSAHVSFSDTREGIKVIHNKKEASMRDRHSANGDCKGI